MKPGVYVNLSNEKYHASEGISKTGLDMFVKDPASLEWAKKCPVDLDKMKSLDFGDACHAMLLEPQRYKRDFVVMPKFGQKKEDKTAKAEWLEEHKDKQIITTDEDKKLSLMFESVMAHPAARKLIESEGIAEQSHYWIDEDTGVLCKCRPDRNICNTPILMDIKTADTMDKFKFALEDYRYFVQAPFYLDGYNSSTGEQKDTFVFLIIQKTIELGRYPVKCVFLPDLAIHEGRKEYKRNLEAYARAKESGTFSGFHEAELSYNFQRRLEII